MQEVQGALSSRPKGDPGPLPIFQDFILLSNHTHDYVKLHMYLFDIEHTCTCNNLYRPELNAILLPCPIQILTKF